MTKQEKRKEIIGVLPHGAADSRLLTEGQKLVLAHLKFMSDAHDGGEFFVDNKHLSEWSTVPLGSVDRCVNKLISLGLIDRTPGKSRGNASTYSVNREAINAIKADGETQEKNMTKYNDYADMEMVKYQLLKLTEAVARIEELLTKITKSTKSVESIGSIGLTKSTKSVTKSVEENDLVDLVQKPLSYSELTKSITKSTKSTKSVERATNTNTNIKSNSNTIPETSPEEKELKEKENTPESTGDATQPRKRGRKRKEYFNEADGFFPTDDTPEPEELDPYWTADAGASDALHNPQPTKNVSQPSSSDEPGPAPDSYYEAFRYLKPVEPATVRFVDESDDPHRGKLTPQDRKRVDWCSSQLDFAFKSYDERVYSEVLAKVMLESEKITDVTQREIVQKRANGIYAVRKQWKDEKAQRADSPSAEDGVHDEKSPAAPDSTVDGLATDKVNVLAWAEAARSAIDSGDADTYSALDEIAVYAVRKYHSGDEALVSECERLLEHRIVTHPSAPKPYPDTEPLGTVISEPTVIEVETVSRTGEPDTVTIRTSY